MRAESGRVKVQLETSQRDLEEVKRQLREKEESVESSVGSMRGELATRAQQVYTYWNRFSEVIVWLICVLSGGCHAGVGDRRIAENTAN